MLLATQRIPIKGAFLKLPLCFLSIIELWILPTMEDYGGYNDRLYLSVGSFSLFPSVCCKVNGWFCGKLT